MIWREHRQNAAVSPPHSFPPNGQTPLSPARPSQFDSSTSIPTRRRQSVAARPLLSTRAKPLRYRPPIPAEPPGPCQNQNGGGAEGKHRIAPTPHPQNPRRRGAPTPRGARILSQRRRRSNPARSVCAGLFRVLNVPAVPEGDHTEGPGWAGLPRRHGHRQRQVHLVESVSLACFFFGVLL